MAFEGQPADPAEVLNQGLNEVCAQIAKADRAEKRAKKEKEAARSKFFDLATRWIQENWTLASEQINVEDFGGLTPQAWVEKHHPGYLIGSMELHDDGSGDLLIEQDPALQKFEWTHDKLVFSRQIAQVGSSFDAQQFFEDACEEGLSELAYSVIDSRTVYDLNQEKAEAYLEEHPEAMGLLQDYAHPGKLQVKLGAPRKAKDEDE